MASLETNGTRIAYQQFGEGPDLIFVHGLAANRAFWFTGLAPLLRDHFRLTLYDLRGHGYSATPETGYSSSNQADDLAALLDHLGIDNAPIVAHSFGGAVALEFAVKHPNRVTQLALLDAKINRLQPTLKLSDCAHLTPFEQELVAEATDIDWEAEDQIGLKFLEAVAERRLAGIQTQVKNDFVPFADQRGSGRDAKHWLKLLHETTAKAEFLSTSGASPEQIAELTMPVLLMYGEYSRVRKSGDRLRELLPHCTYECVPNAGHFFPARAPRVVLQSLKPFLGESTPADEASSPASHTRIATSPFP
ncbi:alpha/beta fold hydrolase [Abyssibacter sp.]|uniref:alpha/beta fold hydrolase n=1 Tax=Abyssibacter sp. TaxID=2320200 RepID=UPI0035192E83